MNAARAVRTNGTGGVDVLELVSLTVPDPGPGQAAVEVRAAGLNRADLLQRRGLYPAPPGVPADIPGLEFAGTVVAIGEDVRSVAVGDRVMGIVGGGAMATRINVAARELCPVPENLKLAEAAAIPEVFATAYDALFLQCRLGLGERALIHAAASGVGTAAIQLASRAGATVLGTSRSVVKLGPCESLGLAHPIDASDGSFAERVKAATGGHGADVILDTVGGSYFAENLASLAPRGRMVTIGLLGGPLASLNLGALMTRRLELRGSVLRTRPAEEKASLAQTLGRVLVPMFERRELSPVIDRILPMTAIREAHELMEDNATIGKIVLQWT